jgi:hypothetical protein
MEHTSIDKNGEKINREIKKKRQSRKSMHAIAHIPLKAKESETWTQTIYREHQY